MRYCGAIKWGFFWGNFFGPLKTNKNKACIKSRETLSLRKTGKLLVTLSDSSCIFYFGNNIRECFCLWAMDMKETGFWMHKSFSTLLWVRLGSLMNTSAAPEPVWEQTLALPLAPAGRPWTFAPVLIVYSRVGAQTRSPLTDRWNNNSWRSEQARCFLWASLKGLLCLHRLHSGKPVHLA